MADSGQTNRPLSPHLSVYRMDLGMTMSIVHRITGTGLAVTATLLVWWFMAAAVSPAHFAFVDGLLTSWVGSTVMLISLWALWFHFFNGVRHLRWDMARGLGIWESNRSGWYTLVLSVLMTTFSIYLTL